ncbi:hydrogen peroxide-inducible genes activator [Yoonia vestfoldensis]|uniref:hydrogen peroxide-inducible genes activator n=1 Tax=Yoonia vestfoldensis TaxID=245188 RepID=UPI000378B225|nr:hydrogen peroxide-inducible genes activator [Yoonia vestfoldensis]
MRDLPSLRQLEYFVALVETGSFKAAAEHCRISQPSLSVQLATLEKRLGQRLVERGRAGVIPTLAGREVYDSARAILDAAQTLVNRFDAPRSGLSGVIRFGASGTLGPYLLPHVIARLHARHPDLQLFIREGPPETLATGLARGDFDMILVQLPVRGDITPIRLFREPLELVVARDHPFVARGRITREDLRGETVLALGPAFALRQQVADLCETLGARLRADYEGNSLDAIRLMAGMGMGIALLPALYVRSEIGPNDADVAVVPIDGPRTLRSVGLVCRSGSIDDAAPRIARLIQSAAREVFSGTLVLEPL